MLSLFYGNNELKVRDAAYEALAARRALGEEEIKIDIDTYTPGSIRNACNAVPLFGPVPVYLLDMPSAHDEYWAEVTDLAEILGAAATHFVMIERTLLAADKKIFTEHATVLEEHKASALPGFNIFRLADALALKDKKLTWLLLQEAREEGMAPEEIIGTLWWQLKSMRIAALTKNASEAGMKDFSYNKAKRALVKFPLDEVEVRARALLTLYHEGHAGKCDIDLALEEWVLRG